MTNAISLQWSRCGTSLAKMVILIARVVAYVVDPLNTSKMPKCLCLSEEKAQIGIPSGVENHS